MPKNCPIFFVYKTAKCVLFLGINDFFLQIFINCGKKKMKNIASKSAGKSSKSASTNLNHAYFSILNFFGYKNRQGNIKVLQKTNLNQ